MSTPSWKLVIQMPLFFILDGDRFDFSFTLIGSSSSSSSLQEFQQAHLIRLTLVDFLSLQESKSFPSTWGVRRDVNLAWKGLKALEFDKTQVRNAKPSKSGNYHWGGKISNFKEKRFPQWKRGRQAVVYMEEVLVVELGFFQLFYYV